MRISRGHGEMTFHGSEHPYVEDTIDTAELLHARHKNRKASAHAYVPRKDVQEAKL